MSEENKNLNTSAPEAQENDALDLSEAAVDSAAKTEEPEKAEAPKTEDKKKKKEGKIKSFMKSRKAKHGSIAIIIVAVVIAITIVINIVCGLLVDRFPNLKLDLTANSAFELQEDTLNYVSDLKQDVTINILASQSDFENNGTYFIQAENLLDKMESASDGKLSLKYVDLSSNPNFASQYPNVNWDSQVSNVILVSSGDQYKALTLEDCFEYDSQYYSYYGSYQFTGTKIEQAVVTAILNVTTENKIVVDMIKGNGEQDYSSVTSLLENNAYQVNEVSLATSGMDDDAEFAVLFAPSVDLDDAAIDKLSAWLDNDGKNGKTLIYIPCADKVDTPNLDKLLSDWGMQVNDGYVFETSNDYLVSNIYSSLHNRKYNDFYFNHIYNENEFRNPALTTQSQSLLYQIYMGQKYLITDDSKALPSHEYKKIKQSGELSLYECEKVFPIGYSTSAVLSEEAFSNMDYPRSLCAVMNNIIVPQGGKDSYECNMITSFPSFELPGRTGISRSGSGYEIRLEKTDEFTVELPQKVSADKLLLVTMDIDNDMSGKGLSSDDAKIFINGIKNNLTDPSWKYYNNNKTFRFVVSSTDGKDIETLKLKFMRGNYDVKNIKCYVMDISNFMQVDEFVFDKQKTKGDNIVGSIDVSNDGYFKLSVPYAEGFTAYVDGKETQVECVDTAFVGFAITKGHHDIKITFTAPLKKAGLLMSASGVAVLVVLMVIEFISKKRKKNTSKKDV